MGEGTLEAAEQVKAAKRAAMIALVLAFAAVVILLIDTGIKRALVEKAVEASRLLDAAQEVARGAQADVGAAGEPGRTGGEPVGFDADVAAPASSGRSSGDDTPVRSQSGAADGVRGDGQ